MAVELCLWEEVRGGQAAREVVMDEEPCLLVHLRWS